MGLLIDEEKVSRRNTSPILTRGNTKSIFILKTIIHQTRSDTPKSRHLVQLPYTSFSFATKTNLGGAHSLLFLQSHFSALFLCQQPVTIKYHEISGPIINMDQYPGGRASTKMNLYRGTIPDYNIYADVTSVSNFHNKMVARSAA